MSIVDRPPIVHQDKPPLERREVDHLLRLVQGEPVPEEDDERLSPYAADVARTLRSATNGVAPIEKLDTLDDGISRALLRRRAELSAGPLLVEVSTESFFPWRTAREIAETTPERPEWIAPGLIAKGAITELDAAIKRGKTEFTARLVKAIVSGDDFLDHPTRRTRIVYLTEQNPTTFREPLRRAGLLDCDDLLVLCLTDTVGMRWDKVAAAAAAKCHEIGAELLIVDTLSAFARLGGDDENSSGKAAEAMSPLQVAAAGGIAVLVLRHDRKGGGEVGESARGSSAFGGAVDIILALRRAEGNTRETIRALHGLSRFDETPATLMIELTEHGYVSLGSEKAVVAREARIALLDNAPHLAEHALTEEELLDRAKAKRSTARPALLELVSTGALVQIGDGKKGSPRRYYRAAGPVIHSVESPCVPTESISSAPVATVTQSDTAPEIHSVETSLYKDRQKRPAETIGSPDVEALPW